MNFFLPALLIASATAAHAPSRFPLQANPQCPAVVNDVIEDQNSAGFVAGLLGASSRVNPKVCTEAFEKEIPTAWDLENVLSSNEVTQVGISRGFISACAAQRFKREWNRKAYVSLFYTIKRTVQDEALNLIESIGAINCILGQPPLTGGASGIPQIVGSEAFAANVEKSCKATPDAFAALLESTSAGAKRQGLNYYSKWYLWAYYWRGLKKKDVEYKERRLNALAASDEQEAALAPWLKSDAVKKYLEGEFFPKFQDGITDEPKSPFRSATYPQGPHFDEAKIDNELATRMPAVLRQALADRRRNLIERLENVEHAARCLDGDRPQACYKKYVAPFLDELPVKSLGLALQNQGDAQNVAAASALNTAACKLDVAKARDRLAKEAGPALASTALDLALLTSGVGAPVASARMMARAGLRLAVEGAEVANQVGRATRFYQGAIVGLQGVNMVRNGFNVTEACSREFEDFMAEQSVSVSDLDRPTCTNVGNPIAVHAGIDYRRCVTTVMATAVDAAAAGVVAKRYFAARRATLGARPGFPLTEAPLPPPAAAPAATQAFEVEVEQSLRRAGYTAKPASSMASQVAERGAGLSRLEQQELVGLLEKMRPAQHTVARQKVLFEAADELVRFYKGSKLKAARAAATLDSLDESALDGLTHALKRARQEVGAGLNHGRALENALRKMRSELGLTSLDDRLIAQLTSCFGALAE